jgi:Fe2+ or Zn2+ uptake regulation protein
VNTVVRVRSPSELVGAFRAQGLKVTPQRQLLFRLLHDNTSHPTAEALFAAASGLMPGISLRTVYQTLNDLAQMGELQQFQFGTGPAHFDPNVSDHHHTLCDACGAIGDVYVDGADTLSIAGLDGFRPAGAAIVFHGQCAACAAD